MNAEEYKVSALYLRGYLAGMRKLTGNQYPRLLEQCGLKQYVQTYPPPTLEIVAQGRQLICLTSTISTFLSPDLYDLFLRNLGREFGRVTASHPTLKAKADQISPVTNRAALRQVVEAVLTLIPSSINEDIVIEDGQGPQELNLLYRGCVHCAGRAKVNKPACVSVITFHKEILQKLTSSRYQIEEIRCGAMHDEPDCRFVLRHS